MTIGNRMQAPTPQFFRMLRTIGITLAAASGTVLTAPLPLTAAVHKIAGYILVAGVVITAVSQAAVESEEKPNKAQ